MDTRRLMQMVVVAAALLLLSIVLSPIVARRFRLARRGRAVHLDGGCHWYANYDEELRYEPHSRSDILRLPREDVLQRGYLPTDEVQNIPRTFRHRVPGDVKIRLWKTGSPDAKALWLCEWAISPVRVAIGIGDRERVAGVESGRVPTEPDILPETLHAIDVCDWPAGSTAPEQAADMPSAVAISESVPIEKAGNEGLRLEARADKEVVGKRMEGADPSAQAPDGADTTTPPANSSDAGSGDHSRRRRRRR